MEHTTANSTGRHVIYSAALPSGTGPARTFEPLKRRTSPVPRNDRALMAQYLEDRPKDTRRFLRASEIWGDRLEPMQVGEAIVCTEGHGACGGACNWWGRKLKRKYVTAKVPGGIRITRVK